ncbi:hypothetical protein ACFQ7Y_43380, partial [Streptomyces sp. NPDC056512]
MVTFAQAQERAEEWINGDVPGYQHREVRVREFELGFVVWAEDREGGPVSDGGRQRLVIARDSGDASLWPGLPVGEVIRRYEEEYGLPEASPEPADAPPERVDLNQTSFLLSPPEWLQEAADKLGIPDRRGDASSGTGSGSRASSASGTGAGTGSAASASAPAPAAPAPVSADAGSGATPWPASPPAPSGATPWTGTDTNADEEEDRSVAPPATVFAPPLVDGGDVPAPTATPEAKTALMSGGSQLPRTAVAPAVGGPAPAAPGTPAPGAPDAYGYPQGAGAQQTPPPGGQGAPGRPLAPGAGDIADAATSKAQGPPRGARGGGATTPPPPGAPGTPGARPSGPGAPGTPAGGYVPTQLVSQLGPDGPEAPPAPGG